MILIASVIKTVQYPNSNIIQALVSEQPFVGGGSDISKGVLYPTWRNFGNATSFGRDRTT